MVHEPSNSNHEDITCREVAAWISAYLDEHVGEERKQQIALHLAACAGCGTYVGQIATVRDLVRLLPKAVEIPANPDQLRKTLTARLGKDSFWKRGV